MDAPSMSRAVAAVSVQQSMGSAMVASLMQPHSTDEAVAQPLAPRSLVAHLGGTLDLRV